MQIRRSLRKNPKLSLYSFTRGFSHISGEKSSDGEKEHTLQEKLDSSNQDEIIIQPNVQSNEKDNKYKVSKVSNSKRIRRGGVGHKTKHVSSQSVNHIKLFSTNGAGVKNGKVNSLNSEIRNTRANIVTVQETHCTHKGKIKMNAQFVVFEAIRKKKGGGTMVAIHEDLNPKLIEEYSDEFELLVVETDTKEKSIRVISGYGPQENLDEEKRLKFFLALEVEIEKAELSGKSVIIEIDANSKLGEKYISGDPHKMSPNGALLAGIIERHGLVVGNGSDKCKGTITRKRTTKGHTEQSVIDIVMFSSDLNKHLKGILIDEKRNHVLTRISKSKRGIQIKESDHNVIITEFDCRAKDREENNREDVYNLKTSNVKVYLRSLHLKQACSPAQSRKKVTLIVSSRGL